MNAPERFELFMQEGDRKVVVQKDTKIQDAATFVIQKEDHTLGNVLRMQLLEDPKVKFAGYRMPHPLEHFIVVKVQTTPNTTPKRVVGDALTELIGECTSIASQFEEEVRRVEQHYA